MKTLERLQKINRDLISRINILSLDKNLNKSLIEVFEDRKFIIQKAMFKR